MIQIIAKVAPQPSLGRLGGLLGASLGTSWEPTPKKHQFGQPFWGPILKPFWDNSQYSFWVSFEDPQEALSMVPRLAIKAIWASIWVPIWTHFGVRLYKGRLDDFAIIYNT